MKKLIILLISFLAIACNPQAKITSPALIYSSIISGRDVLAKDPIASSVVAIYNTKSHNLCTATLIANNIVLTAAHCAPSKASDVKIIFSLDIDKVLNAKEQSPLKELILTATDFKVSPNWDPNNETVQFDTGDIALIKFSGSLPKGYLPAKFLENTGDLKIGASVTVAGFGVNFVDMEEIDPKKYRNLDGEIESGEVACSGKGRGNYGSCFKIDKSGDGLLRTTSAPISFIHETEIRLNEKKAGTCNGDSGGPAFIQKAGTLYLFGVTSRGSELCNEDGVYTNALFYKSWIETTTKIWFQETFGEARSYNPAKRIL